jgi:hypothetical protein
VLAREPGEPVDDITALDAQAPDDKATIVSQ